MAGRRRSSGWLLAAVGVVIAIVFLWGVGYGRCPSSVVDPGGDLACVSGPVTGVPGAWALTVLGALFVGYAVRRYLLRRPRPSGAR